MFNLKSVFNQSVSLTQYVVLSVCLSVPVSFIDLGHQRHGEIMFWAIATLVRMVRDTRHRLYHQEKRSSFGPSITIIFRNTSHPTPGAAGLSLEPSLFLYWCNLTGVYKGKCQQFLFSSVITVCIGYIWDNVRKERIKKK